jgi:hypothetical protein
MDLCEIGSPGFGQAAQHPNDRTSCNHRVSTSSGPGFLVLVVSFAESGRSNLANPSDSGEYHTWQPAAPPFPFLYTPDQSFLPRSWIVASFLFVDVSLGELPPLPIGTGFSKQG